MLDLNDNLSPIPYRCPYPTCGTNRPVTSQTFAAHDRNLTYWPKKNRKISLRHLRPIKNVGDSMRLAVRRKQLTSLTLGNYLWEDRRKQKRIDLVLFCRLCNDSLSEYRYSQFVSFIVNFDVSNDSVNAQQTNYVRKSISSVRSSEIKAKTELGLNMLVLIPSFAIILDRRIAVNSRETCDRSMSLQNTSNCVHLTVRWMNIPSYRR